MRGFGSFLLAMWIILVGVTWRAIAELGLDGGYVFISDFSHPWRAQFNIDFSLHLLLFAIWVFWREESKVLGLVCAILCAFGGAVTFPYLLFAISRARGDVRLVLLGSHCRSNLSHP